LSRVLLVNPNRFVTPPVPPLALEYLQAALDAAGHETRIADLTFADDPLAVLCREIRDFRPFVAGMTLRNVDSVLYRGNEFFLEPMKPLVACLRDAGVTTVLGGAGFTAFRGAALDYLDADYGVSGPGERAFPRLVAALERGEKPEERLIDGWAAGIDPDFAPVARGGGIDYPAYLGRGALAGFETQKGCLGGCPYCPEANGHLLRRSPEAVVRELRLLTEKGVREFHLCDTEFNQSLEHCKLFLETLIAANLSLRWALYMKSSPADSELFSLLKDSGAWLVTLSLPTGGVSWPENAARIAGWCRDNGIRLAVDFLCGLPGDTPESIRRDLDRLRRIAPATVGLNSVIRLYPGCPATVEITASLSERAYLRGTLEGNPGWLFPAFYHRIGPEELKELVGDDPLFRVEGYESGSNYQRV